LSFLSHSWGSMPVGRFAGEHTSKTNGSDSSRAYRPGSRPSFQGNNSIDGGSVISTATAAVRPDVVCAVMMPRPPLKTRQRSGSRFTLRSSREVRLQVLSALDRGSVKLWRDS
jgi:hypothetical protein